MVVVTNRYIHDADIVSTALENLIRLAKANDEYRSGHYHKNMQKLFTSRSRNHEADCDQHA
jgi:hypothetical protein